jgi:hypothetical protein
MKQFALDVALIAGVCLVVMIVVGRWSTAKTLVFPAGA